jgi:hypothetical protein
MSKHEMRTVLLILGGFFILGIGFVFWHTAFNPFARIRDAEDLRRETAAPVSTSKGQVFNVKARSEEWAAAQSVDRSQALPAWSKILNRFRFNVIGSSSDSALQQLNDAESWHGKISGDAALDQRIIKAAILTRLNGQGESWHKLEGALNKAVSNEEIAEALIGIGF